MKKLCYLLSALFLLLGCDANNDPEVVPSVEGITFQRIGYVLEVPIDGNDDGVFSTDLYNETMCFYAPITFETNGRVSNPALDLFLIWGSIPISTESFIRELSVCQAMDNRLLMSKSDFRSLSHLQEKPS